jgi:cell division protein FtsB
MIQKGLTSRKPTKGQRRKLILFGICFVGVLAWFQTSGLRTVLELRESWGREEELSSEIERLKQQNGELENDISELESDGNGVERIARQKLGWAEEGEVVIKVPEKE